jgi:hypothetical protein
MPTRFYSGFLLLIVLAGIGGYYPLFKLEQWHLRQEVKAQIKQGLNKKDLHRVEVTLKDQGEIIWERRGEEFEYRGNMYDVVHADTVGQTIIYYCIDDRAENELSDKLERMMEQEHGKYPSRHKTSSFIKLLSAFVYLVNDRISFEQRFQSCLWPFTCLFFSIQGFSRDILHPPQ